MTHSYALGLGVCVGLPLGALVAYPLGLIHGRWWRDSRRITHEDRLDISEALRRSVR